MSRNEDIDPVAPADIEIGATARAKRLRFARAPEAAVELEGAEGSFSTTERQNLSEEVEPGVEYRDVGVRWHAVARLEVRSTRRLRERRSD